ncbi:MAG: 30S ribosomal protein S20 [Eubacteriales bacterium]|nr:30S ribosomal protein S20 [Eubacteriales bacterium]
MANHKSALKRVSITTKKNLKNRMVSSQLKTIVKKVDTTIASGDADAANAAYLNAVSTVDKAAAKGVIHKNAANRKKAQLAAKMAAK